MAFYGRISQDSQSSMTFDKVYSNRVFMDAQANTDGVFNGRFTLVEYSEAVDVTDEVLHNIVRSYLTDLLQTEAAAAITNYNNYLAELSTALIAAGDNQAQQQDAYYAFNYNVDKLIYKFLGAGYDSTVWRKVINDEGHGMYVMLASLNSVVPTFNIIADPPSDDPQKNPLKPYFDTDSTNVVYNLHMGTSWGWNPQVDVDINDEGFDPVRFDNGDGLNSANNNISLVNSGRSNNIYTGSQVTTDQKQLKISLPIIGSAVSKIWDFIYGSQNDWAIYRDLIQSQDETTDERPVYMPESWLDRGDLSLVLTDSNQNSIYNPTGIWNINGAINTVYDLVGRNIETIEDISDATARDTSFEKIYYHAGSHEFYYKDYTYEYTTLTDSQVGSLTATTFNPYQEYTGNILNYSDTLYTKRLIEQDTTEHTNKSEWYNKVLRATDMHSDVPYYTLTATYLNQFTDPINRISDNTFKTLRDESQGLYMLSAGTIVASFKMTKVQPSNPETGEEGDEYVSNATYYRRISETPQPTDKIYFPVTASVDGYQDLFIKANGNTITTYSENDNGLFYHKTATNSYNPSLPDGTPDTSQTIYEYTLKSVAVTRELANAISAGTLTAGDSRWSVLPSPLVVLDPWVNETPTGEDDAKIRYILEHADDYVWTLDPEDGSYIWRTTPPPMNGTVEGRLQRLLENHNDGLVTYKVEFEPIEEFYEPYSYYWWVGNNETEPPFKTIARHTAKTNTFPDSTYKIMNGTNAVPANGLSATVYNGVNGLDATLTGTAYFVPDQLYWRNPTTGEYELQHTYTSSRPLYKRFELAVANDPLGEFNTGETWNTNLDLEEINSTRGANEKVEVGWKIAKPHLSPLKGYSRNSNTMNGWLLVLNQLLGDSDNIHTRESDVIQGLINTLHDKIKNIKDLKPNALFVTDIYGHLHAAPIGSGTSGDNWLTLETDATVSPPTVRVAHANPGTATKTINQSTVVTSTSALGTDNTFIVPTIGIDSKGHVSSLDAVKLQMPTANYLTNHTLTVSNTAPSSPQAGDIWIQI